MILTCSAVIMTQSRRRSAPRIEITSSSDCALRNNSAMSGLLRQWRIFWCISAISASENPSGTGSVSRGCRREHSHCIRPCRAIPRRRETSVSGFGVNAKRAVKKGGAGLADYSGKSGGGYFGAWVSAVSSTTATVWKLWYRRAGMVLEKPIPPSTYFGNSSESVISSA